MVFLYMCVVFFLRLGSSSYIVEKLNSACCGFYCFSALKSFLCLRVWYILCFMLIADSFLMRVVRITSIMNIGLLKRKKLFHRAQKLGFLKVVGILHFCFNTFYVSCMAKWREVHKILISSWKCSHETRNTIYFYN